MTRAEYIKLFHTEQLNLVAFKRLMDCDEEVLRLVNSAIAHEREQFANHAADIARNAVEIEREACAKVADAWVHAYEHPSKVIAETIRARNNK